MHSAAFAQHRFVFEQIGGLHLGLVNFLTSTHPIRNTRDIENYLARLALVAPRIDEGIADAIPVLSQLATLRHRPQPPARVLAHGQDGFKWKSRFPADQRHGYWMDQIQSSAGRASQDVSVPILKEAGDLLLRSRQVLASTIRRSLVPVSLRRRAFVQHLRRCGDTSNHFDKKKEKGKGTMVFICEGQSAAGSITSYRECLRTATKQASRVRAQAQAAQRLGSQARRDVQPHAGARR